MDNKILNITRRNKTNEPEDKMSDKTLEIIKANAYLEIEKYKSLIDSLIKDIGELSLFRKIFTDVYNEQIKYIFINEILETLIIPIFEETIEVDSDIAKESIELIKEDIYSALVEKYVLMKDNNE